MIRVNLKQLLQRLNRSLTQALEAAAGLCVSSSHYEVSVEHVLLKVCEDPKSDVQEILRHYEIDPSRFIKALQRSIESFRSGNAGKPVFSPMLIDLLEEAWLIGSVEMSQTRLRSGNLFLAIALSPGRTNLGDYTDAFEQINAEDLRKNFSTVVAGTSEDEAPVGDGAASDSEADGSRTHGRDPNSALAKYTRDYTAEARAEELDPVFERDREIRQVIDILARRRKNNPIIVGEPGVGKTALVEGLALRIVEGDVPEVIRDVDLLSLDLGLLQAGASMKGEFENRLKAVISEVKASAKPLILFIDEAHTLIGAGAAAGGSDAANLLKPALARGELRTIAATTWSEYKKYFERDPALSRRFQVVKCDEPSEQAAVAMLRGLRYKYEQSHKIRIPDEALVAAASFASRYISGRLLPDKAVDLIDTAAARVRVSLSSKPDTLDDAERRIVAVEREIDSLKRDEQTGREIEAEDIQALEEEITELKARAAVITDQWMKEKSIADDVIDLTRRVEALANGAQAPADADEKPASDSPPATAESAAADGAEAAQDNGADLPELQSELAGKLRELKEVRGDSPLVHVEVDTEVIARVVADWTGIPVGSMVGDEIDRILNLDENLKKRIKGQDHAIEAISEQIRSAKAGMANPQTPLGIFLLVGPSGVGKTETALAIAELLFGGERFMVTINMSEFQEKHTVSRLLGSPPGYVGYGEGGVLTEAVRQRPYSVVLLDECEKADLDVMNIFYQVFDKGSLADGEGREIDFKNTVIFLTSNLATEEIMASTSGPTPISHADLLAHIRPVLSKHFKPALLARMTPIPYYPLIGEPLKGIIELKMGKLGRRLMDSHAMEFSWEPSVVNQIADRCTEVETGARNIDFILNGTLIPLISRSLLEQMSEGGMAERLNLSLDESGNFAFNFSGSDVK